MNLSILLVIIFRLKVINLLIRIQKENLILVVVIIILGRFILREIGTETEIIRLLKEILIKKETGTGKKKDTKWIKAKNLLKKIILAFKKDDFCVLK